MNEKMQRSKPSPGIDVHSLGTRMEQLDYFYGPIAVSEVDDG
jgi:hypothetical protein